MAAAELSQHPPDNDKNVNALQALIDSMRRQLNLLHEKNSTPTNVQKSISPSKTDGNTQVLQTKNGDEIAKNANMKHVLDMFPNVDANWVRSRFENGVSLENIVNFILLHSNDVPKKKKQQKMAVKPKEAKENLNKEKHSNKIINAPNKKKIVPDYFDTLKDTTDEYAEAALIELCNQFRELAKNSIRTVFVHFNRHYTPSVKFVARALDGLKSKKDMRGMSVDFETEDAEILPLKFLVRKRAVEFTSREQYPQNFKEEFEWAQQNFFGLSNCDSRKENAENKFVECGVCFEEFHTDDLRPCAEGHLFCSACVQSHARESVYGQSAATLLCMDLNCKAGFSRDVLTDCLDVDLLEKLDERYLDENINRAKIDNLVRCSYCNYAAIIDIPIEVNKVFKCENPQCEREVCRVCNVDWEEHVGIPCKEFETKNETKFRREMEEKMAEAIIRRCHSCNAEMIKESGCNKLTCRCGAKMCYLCRAPNIEYNHFCQHVRSPAKACKICSNCSLWEDAKKLDDERLSKLQTEAQKTQEASGTGRIRPIGISDAAPRPRLVLPAAPTPPPDVHPPPQNYRPQNQVYYGRRGGNLQINNNDVRGQNYYQNVPPQPRPYQVWYNNHNNNWPNPFVQQQPAQFLNQNANYYYYQPRYHGANGRAFYDRPNN